jgi:hypothetical protein
LSEISRLEPTDPIGWINYQISTFFDDDKPNALRNGINAINPLAIANNHACRILYNKNSDGTPVLPYESPIVDLGTDIVLFATGGKLAGSLLKQTPAVVLEKVLARNSAGMGSNAAARTVLNDEVTAAASGQYKKIGSTSLVGENYLKTLGGVSQKYFPTTVGKGGRFIDQFVNGVANESKVGYTTLTKDIRMQIAKDAELLSTDPSVKKVVWNFFRSPETGKVGASKPLLEALKKAGIETKIIELPKK